MIFERRHHVAEAVGAQQNRRVLGEIRENDLDEVRRVGLAPLAADVAVDLVAPHVLHGLRLGELAGVLALADRRMIVRELGDPLRRQLVEAAVADVANRQLPAFEHRQRQHACHPLAAGVGLGAVQDLLVGEGNGLTDARLGRAILPGEPVENRLDGNAGGDLPRRLAANAVDDEEDALRGVDVEAILVGVTLAAGIAGAGGGNGRERQRRGPVTPHDG